MTERTPGELTPFEKPSLSEYISNFLPFKLPTIPLPQTRKNFDKALSSLILSGSDLAVAWTTRKSKVADAKSDAIIELIRSGSRAVTEKIAAGESELVERAIVAAMGKSFQAQRNRERIAEFASDELAEDCSIADARAEIDDDWLNAFSEQASRVSKEDMQRLWGRVLAGEIRQPGSFRLRTLLALSIIDAKEAQLIHDHMDLVIEGAALFAGSDDQLVMFDALLELQNIDVIQGVGGYLQRSYSTNANNFCVIPIAANSGVRIQCGKPDTINLSCYLLTPFGKELFALAKPRGFRAGLPEAIARAAKGDGRVIELVKLTLTAPPDMYRIDLLRRLEP